MTGKVSLRPAWVEVDLSAIAHNMKELRRTVASDARIMAVVKANAYGHGAVPVSKTVLENGADYLGVAILDEARELREAGISAPILILGYTPVEQAEEAVSLGVAQTVYSREGAEAISQAAVKLGKKAKIHIKVDTGMGRLGFPAGESSSVDEIIKAATLPGIAPEGILTHFSVADTADKEYTYRQYAQFCKVISRLRNEGFPEVIKHAANSAAIIDLPGVHLDMVRAGISVYGLYPSPEVQKESVDLKPALSFKARAAHVKTVPADTSISYGRTFVTRDEIRAATIPVGYADGYSRLFSNKAYVLARGVRVPVIGTVCMDQFIIDISEVPEVRAGDVVTLIGREGEQSVTADELADLIGTINYEIVCMISNRVPRVYVG
ncbi:alanine racemase [Phosphitispora fastidiosa]|uniref:alanine racemase n=1 Tax=Phosphitispora fastidiosa TaxID=2837202 RepID=UPI0022B14C9C|nr:alanine racemase [Phosphitispora fastidiosa]MBU7007974.1 alanine racemase [Phosphitispora fastidiosa]